MMNCRPGIRGWSGLCRTPGCVTCDAWHEERRQWLESAKTRALEFVDAGELALAYKSLVSDLSQHAGTREHPGLFLTGELFIAGHLNTEESWREHIAGYQ
jgi:hypothetical protein